MEFEESTILFSGGFFISGLNGADCWAAGVATSALVENFIPGTVGTDPTDIKNSIYINQKK